MSVEEIHGQDHSDHEGHDHVEIRGEMGRNERKARKALLEQGLKKVEGINRVVMRRPKNVSRGTARGMDRERWMSA
jgi:nascent polypeptide-associated complex subunit alpha